MSAATPHYEVGNPVATQEHQQITSNEEKEAGALSSSQSPKDDVSEQSGDGVPKKKKFGQLDGVARESEAQQHANH